jgi:hypothetical protein
MGCRPVNYFRISRTSFSAGAEENCIICCTSLLPKMSISAYFKNSILAAAPELIQFELVTRLQPNRFWKVPLETCQIEPPAPTQ